MFPLIRLRLRAFRVALVDRALRRMSRRNQVLVALISGAVARAAAHRLLWRGVVRDGESLVVTVRRPGPADAPGSG